MEAGIPSLIAAADQGDAAARERLFSELYSELHRLAKRQLGRSPAQLTLSATALLHEAYVDMASRQGPSFPDENRFMAYAARVMRGLIIDHARRRCAMKRGAHFEITSMPTDLGEQPADDVELTKISDALDELAEVEPLLAEIVDLKFFCGLTFAEIAAMRKVSERTVQRDWDKARVYLFQGLQEYPGLGIR